jgi:hypothetical protein
MHREQEERRSEKEERERARVSVVGRGARGWTDEECA